METIWFPRLGILIHSFVVTLAVLIVPHARAQDWSSIRERARESVVFIKTITRNRDGTNQETSTATGFIVSPQGYVITVAHAVPRPADDAIADYSASLGTRYEHAYKLEFIDSDPELDLALLTLPTHRQWQALDFIEDSSAVREETKLYVLGFPKESDLSSADGRLSSRNGVRGTWQTTVPINPGNSGGPVFDESGRVVGVAAGGYDSAQGITFVIPANYTRRILSIISAEPPKRAPETTTSQPEAKLPPFTRAAFRSTKYHCVTFDLTAPNCSKLALLDSSTKVGDSCVCINPTTKLTDKGRVQLIKESSVNLLLFDLEHHCVTSDLKAPNCSILFFNKVGDPCECTNPVTKVITKGRVLRKWWMPITK